MPFVSRTISALFSKVGVPPPALVPPNSFGSGPGAPVISIVLLRTVLVPELPALPPAMSPPGR